MQKQFFDRFRIADYSSLGVEQKSAVEALIVKNIGIGSPEILKLELKWIEDFPDRMGLCLMDGTKPFGFIYAKTGIRTENGMMMKIDYAVCPFSNSKRDFIKAGGSRRVDPMLELTKSALLWGIEKNCAGIIAAEPLHINGQRLLEKLMSLEYISSRSKLILRDRFESHWEESEGKDKGRQKGRETEQSKYSHEISERVHDKEDSRKVYQDGSGKPSIYGRCSGEISVNFIKDEQFLTSIRQDPFLAERLQRAVRNNPKIAALMSRLPKAEMGVNLMRIRLMQTLNKRAVQLKQKKVQRPIRKRG